MRTFFSILFMSFMMFAGPGRAALADGGRKAPPPLVEVAAVGLKNAHRPEKYVGHVEAIVSIDLQARVEGYIEKVNFREGALVKKGRPLYVIEQPPYRARVDAAKAQVVQAEANLFKAETRLRRLRSAQPESVPQTDLDDATAARDLARGQLQEAEAQLKLAQIDLDYTTIKAPMTGRIGKSFFKKGDLVSPSSRPLAEIVSTDPIRVVFSVSEKQVDNIQKAFADSNRQTDNDTLSVHITFPDKSRYPGEGTVEFVDNRIDPDTGTIAVWARFDNPGGRLVPGEYVNAFVQPAGADMQPAVPQRCVQRDRTGAFVFVVDKNSTVKKRRIQTGRTVGDTFIVTSGLGKGEKVIVQGLQKVTPGMTVKTRTAQKQDS